MYYLMYYIYIYIHVSDCDNRLHEIRTPIAPSSICEKKMQEERVKKIGG